MDNPMSKTMHHDYSNRMDISDLKTMDTQSLSKARAVQELRIKLDADPENEMLRKKFNQAVKELNG